MEIRCFRLAALLVLAGLLLSACRETAVPVPPPTATPGVTLTPFQSPMPSATGTAAPLQVLSPTAPPTPTATPFLYTIAEGDTLIGIAFRFGLTLADLLAANPEVDPQFLVIGETLVIPLQDNPAAAAAVPTPVGELRPIGETVCQPETSGGMWCFHFYENTGEIAVEGVSVRLALYDADGEQIDSRTALTPINLVPPGAAVPVAAWFPAVEEFALAAVELLTALPVAPDDARYIPVEASVTQAQTDLAVEVTIQAAPEGDVSVGRLRAALVALDAAGNIVGLRVLEVAVSDLAPPWALSGTVYSLAGEIDRVEVWVEAYP